MKAYTLDLRERVVKFVAGGGTRAQAARLLFGWANAPSIATWPQPKRTTWPPEPVGATGASWIRINLRRTSTTTPTPRSRNCKGFLASAITPCGSASGNWASRFEKKLIKYRERNEVQRWLFRRELKNRLPPACITSTSAAWITGCIGNTDAPPEVSGFMRRWLASSRERTSVIAACQNGKLVAPLTFAGTCNTEVVDASLRRCFCRNCRRAA